MPYVFIPFVDSTAVFEQHARRIGTLVRYDATNTVLLKDVHPANDELYVMGHCTAGSTMLYLHPAKEIPSVSAQGVADRLIASGLPQKARTITLLACQAGRPDAGVSFAALLEGALRKRLYPITIVASKQAISEPDFMGRTYEPQDPKNRRAGLRQFAGPQGSSSQS